MSCSARDFTALRTSKAVSLITLGCAKNEVDSAHMEERLLDAGYLMVDDPEESDVVIVNTCAFIQAATEESLDTIFELADLGCVEQGRTKLVVAGCMPARYGADLESELSEADAFVPCSKEDDIVRIVDCLAGVVSDGAGSALGADASVPCGNDSTSDEVEPEEQTAVASVEEQAVSASAEEQAAVASAYVKISDGCDRFCSYCTIPFIRGRYHSFSYEDICCEIDKHLARGVREITLIAQDTGRWGADFEQPSSLAELMANLANAYPNTWLRVLYIQPEGITDQLLDVVAAHSNICPYFDIPLQHVSERVLRSMNRRGSREAFEALTERILSRIPHATLRTTLIAGYPGETEEEFEVLCEFVEDSPFHYIGTFAYSQEEGTKAASLPDQIEDDEKAERAQKLRDLADAVCTARIAERIGQSMDVLVEGCEEDGQLYGRAMCQAPEVDGVVYLPDGTVGSVVRVRITDTLLYEMEGE